MKKYSSYEEIEMDVDKGITVYWTNELYKVKKMCGAYIVFCESTSFSGGLISLNGEDGLSCFYSL